MFAYGVILAIVLVVALAVAGLPIWPQSKKWRFYPIIAVSVIILIIILFVLGAGRLGHRHNGARSSQTGSRSNSSTPSQTTLLAVTLSPSTVMLKVGQTQQFTASGTYSNGSTNDLMSSATWSSSNAAVATVSLGGLATAVACGSVTVTSKMTEVSGSATATVNSYPDWSGLRVRGCR